MLAAGQSAQITTSVNPELMGGMIVNIGDKYTEMKECYSIFTLIIRLVKLKIRTPGLKRTSIGYEIIPSKFENRQ